jgi:hypothetical protein
LVVIGALGGVGWLLGDDPAGVAADPGLTQRVGAAAQAGRITNAEALPELPVGGGKAERLKPDVGTPRFDERMARPKGPNRRISGTVVRASDGSPLAGVRVHAQSLEQLFAATVTSSDPPGVFDFDGVPASVDMLIVTSLGPWPTRLEEFTVDSSPVDLAADSVPDVTGLVLRFDSGFILGGRVMDEAGAPLAGATVVAGRGRHALATTDSAGRFLGYDVAPREGTESVKVEASARGYQRANVDVLVPSESQGVHGVELVLKGAGVLFGSVTTTGGRPVQGAELQLEWSMTDKHAKRASRALKTLSNAQGDYTIDHVPAGRYVVSAEPAAAADALEFVGVRFTEVVVLQGESTQLDVVLSGGSVISGRVNDDRGNPVPGVELELEWVERWPRKASRSSTTTSSSGDKIVSARHEGPGAETVLMTTEGQAVADELGNYEFRRVTPGEKIITIADVVANASDGLVTGRRTIFVLPDTDQSGVDLTLPAETFLRSQVVDEFGQPLQGASVQVRPLDSHSFDGRMSVETDVNGRFELASFGLERCRLLIMKEGYLTLVEEVDPMAVPTTFSMLVAPQIRGVVTNALDGEPITQFTVKVVVGNSSWSSTTRWSEGRFQIDVNTDEPAAVSIIAPGYEEGRFEEIRPSYTLDERLRFQLRPRP